MTTYTPRELAAELGYTNESRPGKVVRDYLRQIRLHRVRAQLVAGEAPTTVIADVARGWGFGHLGRFASYYADTFGERPSDTLRRPSR